MAIIEIREPRSFKIFLAVIKTLVDCSKSGSPDKPPVSSLYLDLTFLLTVVLEMIKPCNLCPHMKKIELPKILDCLKNYKNEIKIDQDIAKNAKKAISRMIEVGR